MPVKFYYVLAFNHGLIPLDTIYDQPHYLGKTTDLSFKTEPDKSLDLDDGSTEIGSEKLSISFSILGAIDEPRPIGEVWLVPAISRGNFPAEEFPKGDVLRIYLNMADDYHMETKTGEFELTRFSATIRYAVSAPAYDYDLDFFKNYRVHLFPNIPPAKLEMGFMAERESNGDELAWSPSFDERIIYRHAALITTYIAEDLSVRYVNGDLIAYLDYAERGVFIHQL